MVMHANKDNEQNRDKFGWSQVYCDNEVVSTREKVEWGLLSTQRLRASFSFLWMIQLRIYLSLSLSIPPPRFSPHLLYSWSFFCLIFSPSIFTFLPSFLFILHLLISLLHLSLFAYFSFFPSHSLFSFSLFLALYINSFYIFLRPIFQAFFQIFCFFFFRTI